MRRTVLSRRRLVAVIALATTAVAALSAGTASASATHHGYRQTNLVSDIPGASKCCGFESTTP